MAARTSRHNVHKCLHAGAWLITALVALPEPDRYMSSTAVLAASMVSTAVKRAVLRDDCQPRTSLAVTFNRTKIVVTHTACRPGHHQ